MQTEDDDKPKSYTRAWRWIGSLVVVLALCATLLLFIERPCPQPLLDRASVALTFEWPDRAMLCALNDGMPVIATLSDTNWLIGQAELTGNIGIQYKMDRLEWKSQRRVANPRLASILNRNGALVGDIEPSPDGRWVIGTLSTDHDPYPESPMRRVAAAIDGSRFTQWSANIPKDSSDPSSRGANGSYIAWMPDSRNVAEIVADQHPSGTLRLQGTLHDVYSGCTSTLQFSAPSLPKRGAQLAIRPGVLFLSSISDYRQAWASPLPRLGLTDTEVIFDLARIKSTTVDLYAWPLHQSGAVPQISHPQTPSGTWLVGLAFSPDGKRLAWEVVRESHPSTLERLLCRLWRRSAPTSSCQIEVWTSGIDGSDMEMLGDLPPSTEDWNAGMRLNLSWLPSGKGLRFVFKDKIYTVQAD